MTQLRSSSFVGQAAEDRVQAVVQFGFTERQARFLVTVMLHSGVCLPRQYEAFAGIVHGKRTGRFFQKLIKHGYAAAYPCRHNRGRVYHVHHKPLYRAIGQTNSRHRRPMSAARVEEALMLLDAMLIDPKVMWLATTEEKRIHLSRQAGVSAGDAATLTATQRAASPVRSVRDRMPVGSDQEGRWVFLYLITDLQREDFHWFLQQHSALFAVLPAWVVQIVCLPRGNVAELYEKEARHALQPVSSRAASGLRWYFKLHCAHTQEGAPLGDEEQDYYEAREAFGAPRMKVLYQRWLNEGDSAFEAISSGAVAEALKSGIGKVECYVLPFAYRHLSPLGSAQPKSQGAEDADDSHAPSRPPASSSIAVLNKPANNATQMGG